MSTPFADAITRPVLVGISSLVLISLASCAKADQHEAFVADPAMQSDYIGSLPTSGSSGGFEYEIIQGFAVLEGDILLGRVNSAGKLTNELQARGVGKNDVFGRWPDGIVVYEKPVENSQLQQRKVEEAINHWTENTTLTFVERNDDNADQYPHYIQFLDSQSCASHVGMIGGPQPVFVSDACSVGSVIHEIGHAIGLFHEHTRADRNNFVQIDWSEIIDGKALNFNLQNANTDTYSAYDYGSIMHYGRYFFSKSDKPTIIVNDAITIGQRKALSPLDIESVNNMYQTDLALGPLASTVIDNGMELDVTIYNQGSLGAQQIELLMQIDDESLWTGISDGSGWDCMAYDLELKCTRDTLREQTESRFTIVVNTSSRTIDNLSVRLGSRTQDFDTSNNTMNDEGVQWQSLDLEPRSESSDYEDLDVVSVDPETSENGSPPTLLAATQASASDDSVASASAGSTGGPILALLMSIAGARRLRR